MPTCGDGQTTFFELHGSRTCRIDSTGRGTAIRVYRIMERDPNVAILHPSLPDYDDGFPGHPELVAKERSVEQPPTVDFCFVTVHYVAERMDPIEASQELRLVVSLSYQTETVHQEVALSQTHFPAGETGPGNIIGIQEDGTVQGVDVSVGFLVVNYSTWRDSLPSVLMNAGKLDEGLWYRIVDNTGGADFTNRGAPNNNVGTLFLCTSGGYPTDWGTGWLRENAQSGMSAAYRRSIMEANDSQVVNIDAYKEWAVEEMRFLGAEFEQQTEAHTLASGSLQAGVTYRITATGGGFDVTPYGAPNNTVGTVFTAITTGTPTWGTGAVERPEAWRVNYQFQVRANRITGSTLGPLNVDFYGVGPTDVEKPGQHYLWYQIARPIDPTTRLWEFGPKSAHVAQVYEETTFNTVFII